MSADTDHVLAVALHVQVDGHLVPLELHRADVDRDAILRWWSMLLHAASTDHAHARPPLLVWRELRTTFAVDAFTRMHPSIPDLRSSPDLLHTVRP